MVNEPSKSSGTSSPIAAHAVHEAITIARLLGKLAVAMPDAVSTVKIARPLAALRMDATVPVIIAFYVKLWLHAIPPLPI